MKKLFAALMLCFCLASTAASADAYVPAVNSPMGCTTIGQNVLYDGNKLTCDWQTYSNILGTPTLSAIATSGAWTDVLGKPTIPVIQAYEGTTQRLNPLLVNKTATVAGGAGNALFYITNDGTSTGTALCPNGTMLNSPNISVNDATAPYQFSWAWSNSNKTLTVLSQKASGLAVLTFTLLGIPAPVPNGTVVNATIICY